MAILGRASLSILLLAPCLAVAQNTPPPELSEMASAAPAKYIVLPARNTIASVREKNPDAGKKLWIASILALVAANAFDAASSFGRQEANPFLRGSNGQFSPARGFAIKSASTGGLLTLQFLLVRNRPEARRTASIINFVSAGAIAATAARNSTNSK